MSIYRVVVPVHGASHQCSAAKARTKENDGSKGTSPLRIGVVSMHDQLP
jgi:hypothetical protein